MAWQFYVIIFVLIIWVIHFIINLGNERIRQFKAYYLETNIPIIFENGWSKEKVFYLKYKNISNKKIIGFGIMLEITNEGGENQYDEYWISLETDPLIPLIGRSIKLEATLLDVEKQEIINAFPMKVQFLDGSVWDLK